MRSVFFENLHKAMRGDKKLFLLVGDTGFNLVEPLFEEFPDRTLNVGVAEQNLIGISAGLCNAGFRPVCYAISNFLIHRCLEQIRNDLCLHNYPVTLVGTATGFDNGGLGATHHVVDDIGCLKPLPHIKIYSPSSKESIPVIFEEVMKGDSPAYIRIAKSSFSEAGPVKMINRFIVKNNDSEVLVISHGKMVKNAFEAAGPSPSFSVFAMDKLKPMEEPGTINLLSTYKQVVVVEDNFNSGLYNSLCQFAVEKNIRTCKLHSLSPIEGYEERVGDAAFLEEKHGLTPNQIGQFIRSLSTT